MWKLVAKFKDKVFCFLLVIKKRSDDGEDLLGIEDK